MTNTAPARRIDRLAAALHLDRWAELRAWCHQLMGLWTTASMNHAGRRTKSGLADTSDDGMLEMLARAIVMRPRSRWERAAVRATVGLHAIRRRAAGATGEEGLTHFKQILQHALPAATVRTAEQTRLAKEMVRWWVEAYYEPDA